MRPRRASYAAKLIPTYGATPIAVATRPRYNARMPPSSRITFRVMPHMVSSESNGRADVWSAEASLSFDDVDAPVDEGGGMDDDDDDDDNDAAEPFAAIMEAVAIDNRECTRSSGYVVPVTENNKRRQRKQTQGHAASRIGRTDRSNASQSTTSQSGGGIQLFLPV